MAGEDDDALTQEEIDALDGGEDDETEGEGEGEEGDGEDEDASRLDADGEEGEEGKGDRSKGGKGEKVLGRGAKRFQTLRNELKDARAEAKRDREEFERRLAGIQGGGQQQQVDPRLEAERLAAMTPEERMQHQLQQSTQTHQMEMMRMRYEMADREDRNEFRQRFLTDPRAKKYADDVERALGQARQAGMNPKREMLYYYLLGQKVANAKGVKGRQQSEGAGRLRRATTRPSSSGSDTPARRGGKTLEQRLEGEFI